MPRVRYLSNTLSSALISALIGARLSDIQCGYRLYDVAAFQRVPTEESGFNLETEIVARAVRMGVTVGEVPVRCLYPEGVARSHYRTLYDSWQIARVAMRGRRGA
jgi:hypothetical protein